MRPYYRSIKPENKGEVRHNRLRVRLGRALGLSFLALLAMGIPNAAADMDVRFPIPALPDHFPLFYSDRYARFTASTFQGLNLAKGMEVRGSELYRRTDPAPREILSDVAPDWLLEVRVGEQWNVHGRFFLLDGSPLGIGAGGSYAILLGHPPDEPYHLKGYVLSIGGEAGYTRGAVRPDWGEEGETLSLHLVGGAHLFKRLRFFAGWRDQGGFIHLRLREGYEEGLGRFFLWLGGPLLGVSYAGQYVGITYQGQAAFVGGLSSVVPLQTFSFFVQY